MTYLNRHVTITDTCIQMIPCYENGQYFWFHTGFQKQVYCAYVSFEEMYQNTLVPAMRQKLIDWKGILVDPSQTKRKGAR